MPITLVEDNQSRSATITRLGRRGRSVHKRSYKLFGSTDDIEVHAYLNQELTAQGLFWDYPGAGDQRLQAESYSVEYLGGDAWHVTVDYVKEGGADDDNQTDPLRSSRSFDTGGGTQHITQAYPIQDSYNIGLLDFPVENGEKRYPRTGSNAAPTQKGAIGVDGNSVQGVDIVVPALQWTETYDVPAIYVSTNYIKSIASLTGTVNDAPFRGFPAGEVLFIGATGSQEWNEAKGDGPWNLSFKFVQSPNAGPNTSGQNPTDTLPQISIGDITGISKKGHEYLWVRYEDNVESNALIKRPRFVYVNSVYRQENFGRLGIGVT
jgi:hypothetical protein